jgi:hypothetical protein
MIGNTTFVAQKSDTYPDGLQLDTEIECFVAGKDAPFEDGATRVIPGSHLWEHECRTTTPPYFHDVRKLSLWRRCKHGNVSGAISSQLLYDKGIVETEENHYISFTRGETRAMDTDVQKIADIS